MNLTIATFLKIGIISMGVMVGFLKEQQLTAANKRFWIFLIVALASEILESIMARAFRNNFPLYHIFRPLFYILLTIALSLELYRFRHFFLLTIPVVVAAALIDAIYFQPILTQLNTLVISLISLFLVLQVLFYVAVLFENFNWQETLYNHSFFIALGILVHSISSFLTLGIYNFLEADGQNTIINYLIVSEWIFYGSFALNFIIQKKQVTQ